MKRLCIFDLDGTILDTAPGIMASANAAAEKLGVQPLAEDILQGTIGVPIHDIYRQYYHLDDNDIPKAVNLFRLEYTEHGMYQGSIYPGIPELLAALKTADCVLTVATMKATRIAMMSLEAYNLLHFFDAVLGKGDDPAVTKTTMIQSCMERFSATADTTLMIGDSSQDEEGATGAGVRFIGVAWGYGGLHAGVQNTGELLTEIMR